MKTLIAHSAIAAALGVLVAGAVLSPAEAQAQTASAPAAASRQAAPPVTALDRQFRAIADEEWAWRQQEMPSRASRPKTLPDVSAATQQRRLAYWSAVQQRLNAISPDQLSPT
jgi:hypothetical protein